MLMYDNIRHLWIFLVNFNKGILKFILIYVNIWWYMIIYDDVLIFIPEIILDNILLISKLFDFLDETLSNTISRIGSGQSR